jgi:hypothetical protein
MPLKTRSLTALAVVEAVAVSEAPVAHLAAVAVAAVDTKSSSGRSSENPTKKRGNVDNSIFGIK